MLVEEKLKNKIFLINNISCLTCESYIFKTNHVLNFYYDIFINNICLKQSMIISQECFSFIMILLIMKSTDALYLKNKSQF